MAVRDDEIGGDDRFLRAVYPSLVRSSTTHQMRMISCRRRCRAEPAIVKPMPATLDDYLERAVTERAMNADLVLVPGSDARYQPTSTTRRSTQSPSTSRFGA